MFWLNLNWQTKIVLQVFWLVLFFLVEVCIQRKIGGRYTTMRPESMQEKKTYLHSRFLRNSYHLNVCYITGIYSVQYIIMWCLALMENQWKDKPATAETILKQFLNWHMEGLCDWFWLLLDFNTIHWELIDCQTSSCGLSTNCQVSPRLLLLLSCRFSAPYSSQCMLQRVDKFGLQQICLINEQKSSHK